MQRAVGEKQCGINMKEMEAHIVPIKIKRDSNYNIRRCSLYVYNNNTIRTFFDQ
jgi:hypothetical protein